MAPRIILGTRNAEVGLWVSTPGKSALSTTFEDLLIDTTRINTQAVFKGQIINPRIFLDLSRSYSWGSDGVSVAIWTTGYYMEVVSHNLGYVPLCHVSIGSDFAGDIYPQVFLTDTNLYLLYREQTPENDRPAYYDFNLRMNYTILRQRAV